jgi:hypothetical protein
VKDLAKDLLAALRDDDRLRCALGAARARAMARVCF